MNLRLQKKIAAQVLQVGKGRVWIDPAAIEDVANAITKDDIRELIQSGVIKRKPVKGTSRVRARVRYLKKKAGRRRGHGSRKGRAGAREGRKEHWMKRIRALRRRLRELKESGEIDRQTYRMLYRKAKGGEFRNVAHLEAYIEAHGYKR
jgi:large subunit ribosomal protein L19e